MNWYAIENIDTIDSPALVLYPERIKYNIEKAIQMTGDPKRLQPHVKTSKIPEVVSLMLDQQIVSFKCATIAEAEMVAETGGNAILLSMQPVGVKITRYVALIKKFPKVEFACLVDSFVIAADIQEHLHQENVLSGIYIDIDAGMHRTGIAPGRDAVELYKKCAEYSHMLVKGFHVYDGHLRNPDVKMRSIQAEQIFEPVKQMRKELEQLGFGYPQLIAGGSPTFPYHSQQADRISSPGTFVFWDRGYSLQCPEQEFQTAALVISRIISLPTPTRICTDLGHKSVASENELDKRIYFLNAPELVAVGHSEEHLILEAEAGHHYKPGDILYGLPYHICPTVALYDNAHTIENNKTTGIWNVTARRRKLSI